MHLALATCRQYPELSDSNLLLRNALVEAGADVEILPWNAAPLARFGACDAVLVRQCWDYQDDAAGFAAWISRLDLMGGIVLNKPALCIWNNDKRHITELDALGVRTPATVSADDVEAALDTLPGDRVVLKPAFGGSGVGVRLAARDDVAAVLAEARAEAPGRPFMVQEFCPEIAEGEWSLTLIGSRVDFAVRKRPAAGEFRVNTRYQPVVEVMTPPDAARAAAERLVAALGGGVYAARVDGVMRDGDFICTELELTDPDLHLHMVDAAARRLAHHVLDHLQGGTG